MIEHRCVGKYIWIFVSVNRKECLTLNDFGVPMNLNAENEDNALLCNRQCIALVGGKYQGYHVQRYQRLIGEGAQTKTDSSAPLRVKYKSNDKWGRLR